MSDKIDDNDTALCLVAHGQYAEMELAELAANGQRQGKIIRFAVKDRHNPEIVIGEMVVAVFCGSAEKIKQVVEVLRGVANGN